MCRKPEFKSTKLTRLNANSVDENITDNSYNAVSNMDHNPEYKFDYDNLDKNIVASIARNILQIEPNKYDSA